MPIAAPDSQPVPRSRRPGRLAVIVCLGVVLIAVSLGVRNSSWARERRLRTLTLEELALAIHDSPDDALTFMHYGGKLLTAGYVDAGEQAFSRAVSLDPKLARANLGLGAARFRKRNIAGAKESFEATIRLNPNELDAYLGLAQCFYQMGRGVPAVEALQKLVKLDPRNANAWYSMGKIHGELREADKAYDALKKATELNPNQPDYWRDLGQVCRHYTRFAEAESHLKRALRLSQRDPVTYYWIGQLYMQMGDTPKLRGYAESALGHAITRDPTMPEPYYELGRLYSRSKNYKMAVLKLRKARELDASDDKTLLLLGQCLVGLGQEAEGKDLIEGAKKLAAAKDEILVMQKRVMEQPRAAQLRVRLGDVYRTYGNVERALKQYELAMQLGMPGDAAARKAEACRAEMKKRGIVPGGVPTDIPLSQ